ncbi:MAG TPA: MaoC family dehydratase N-terminal domain-containing protein [Steroidobacteraceae bacterium]
MTAPFASADLAHWREWIGRQEMREQRLDIESLRRYAVAIGEQAAVEDSMPSLGHWAWFLPTVAASDIGEDGHPKRGGFLPPVSLPRRMFAAASIRFHASPRLDGHATLTSTIADVRHRSGRSGDLVFVEVERRLEQAQRTCIEEKQTMVYRAAGGRVPHVVEAEGAWRGDAGELWNPGPVDLFRFSAATFNAHRIHYDLRYATEVEGYPSLVVHAPFTAARLFGYARSRTHRTPRVFTFRAQAPLFVSQPVRLVVGEVEGEYRAVRCDGEVAMVATVEFS